MPGLSPSGNSLYKSRLPHLLYAQESSEGPERRQRQCGTLRLRVVSSNVSLAFPLAWIWPLNKAIVIYNEVNNLWPLIINAAVFPHVRLSKMITVLKLDRC